jgi:hypothetical protein
LLKLTQQVGRLPEAASLAEEVEVLVDLHVVRAVCHWMILADGVHRFSSKEVEILLAVKEGV